MSATLSMQHGPSAYVIPEGALARWARERLQRTARADGSVIYQFNLSGSTCNNVSLEMVMTVALSADGRIEAATARPAAAADRGCDAMCAAECSGTRFLSVFGGCDEVLGLTLEQAAFREWHAEPSGCFCTAGNRRHKWRNVFQALHYAAAHNP